MSLFAVRRPVGGDAGNELARELDEATARGGRPVAGYWTADDGELLALYESDSESPAGDGPDNVLAVELVTPDEYGPPDVSSRAEGANDLQLVLVRRQLEPLTPGEFRAIALQAIMCAYEYSDMRWLRSYWARETDQLFCLFETKSHDLVREHAERSRIPCDEVHDAVEILPLEGGIREEA
jgi:hypothetical protein